MEELKELLSKAKESEKNALSKILNSKDSSAENIVKAFRWKSQSIFGHMFSNKPTYLQIVRQVAKNLKITRPSSNTVQELEIKICRKVLTTALEKLTEKQRKELEDKLVQESNKYGQTSDLILNTGLLSALTSAQLSGFGVYILSTTALSAVSGAIGITLPMIFYTGMTKILSLIIGPPGWVGLGLFATWKLTGPNYPKLVSAVICVCNIRARIEMEKPKKIGFLEKINFFLRKIKKLFLKN